MVYFLLRLLHINDQVDNYGYNSMMLMEAAAVVVASTTATAAMVVVNIW